jgi:hypothetical protein
MDPWNEHRWHLICGIAISKIFEVTYDVVWVVCLVLAARFQFHHVKTMII